MSDNESSHSKNQYSFAGKLPHLAEIGIALALVVAGYAWAGGFLAPGQLDQRLIVDTFQNINGVHPGFRRNHAKGVCMTGWFDSNGNGSRLSRAEIFQPGRFPVYGRFALAGGMPMATDTPASIRSLAVNFSTPNGEDWRIGTLDLPVFPFQNPQAFAAQLRTTIPDPATGKPDQVKIDAFFAGNPASAKAIGIIKSRPFSSGFANASYNGLNAFLAIDDADVATPVRWSLVAADPFEAETTAPKDPNYLFDTLIARVQEGPVEWRLVLTVGEPEDDTNDPTVPWPAERTRIDTGTLTVDAIEPEAPGNCRDINFDPLVLPDGIEASDDPLLSARSATYSVSFTRRAGEPKSPSEIELGTTRPAKGP